MIKNIAECSMKLIIRIQLRAQTCIVPFDKCRTDEQTLQPEQVNGISDGSETKEGKNAKINVIKGY